MTHSKTRGTWTVLAAAAALAAVPVVASACEGRARTTTATATTGCQGKVRVAAADVAIDQTAPTPAAYTVQHAVLAGDDATAPRVAFVGDDTPHRYVVRAGSGEDSGGGVWVSRTGDGDAERREIRFEDGRVRIQTEPAPDKPWLGVLLEPTDEGLKVLGVMEGSPAQRAGLEAGDVITAVDGRETSELEGAEGMLGDAAAGSRVRLTFQRDGRERTQRVRLEQHPGTVEFEVPEGSGSFSFGGVRGFHHGDAAHAFAMRVPQRPRLGVVLGDLSDQLAEYFGVEEGTGMLIERVVDDTPAARAGLEAGDVIVRVGDTAVADVGDIREALSAYESGEAVQVDVMRRGVLRTFTAELDTDPPEHGSFTIGGAPRVIMRQARIGDGGTEDIHVAIGEALEGALGEAVIALENVEGMVDLERIEVLAREALEAAGQEGHGARVLRFQSEDGSEPVVVTPQPGGTLQWVGSDLGWAL